MSQILKCYKEERRGEKGTEHSENEGRPRGKKKQRKVVSSLGTAVSKDLMRDLTVYPGSEDVLLPLPLPSVRKLTGAFWDMVIRRQ